MPELVDTLLPRDWGDYDQLVASMHDIHRVAAPEVESGFSGVKICHPNTDGTYFYFPHPTDGEEILHFTHGLVAEADDLSRSLIVPKSIIAAHLFMDGNGRASRRAHAILAGRSEANITDLGIDGPRIWDGSDAEARSIIDFRTPAALESYLETSVYEAAGIAKRLNLGDGFTVTNEGVRVYNELLDRLPEKYKEDLEETVLGVIPYNGRFLVQLLDEESVNFALNAQRLSEENDSEVCIDLAATLAGLGEDGVVRLVDDVWRYRLLRAKASIACLAQTALGSQIISLQGEKPTTLRNHFINLSNNLVKDRV